MENLIIGLFAVGLLGFLLLPRRQPPTVIYVEQMPDPNPGTIAGCLPALVVIIVFLLLIAHPF